MEINRQQAWKLLNSHMKNQNLIRHCLSVEAAMKGLANHFGEDENLWGIVGLLHDGDYEETKENPTRHTLKMVEWLKKLGVTDKSLISAILSHNYAHLDRRSLGEGGYGHPPKNNLEWSLYCADELTGLIVAVALVKGKKLANVSVDSVLKKFPQKNFAAGVHREQISQCEEKLNIGLPEFIGIALKAMQGISQELGL